MDGEQHMSDHDLLDEIRRLRKDVEELTMACQLLFRRNRELLDELSRSDHARPSMDQGPRRGTRRVEKRHLAVVPARTDA